VAATLLLAAALLVAPRLGHDDDGDMQLYLVLARHMAGPGGDWLLPSYLPAVYPRFLEHLPFGLWPLAVAVRLGGTAGAEALCVLLSLLTVALSGWLAARAAAAGPQDAGPQDAPPAGPAAQAGAGAGVWAGVVAMAVLALTESFFVTGGRPRLDVPLLLLASAGAAPLLDGGRWTAGRLLGAAGLAGAAALVKGPFGLVPLAGAVAAGVLVGPGPARGARLRAGAWGAGALLLATAPLLAFLLVDRATGGPWWEGYVEQQLLASATGARQDGERAWWLPLRTVLGRFWPGLPLLLLAAWGALRRGAPGGLRRLGVAGLVALVALCLPARKLWFHALVAFPLLAALAGAGAGPHLARWVATRGGRARALAAGLCALALLATGLAAAGQGRHLLAPPCLVHAEFAHALQPLPAGSRVALVSPTTDWRLLSQLAFERGLLPEPHARLPEEDAGLRAALVHEGAPVPGPAWREAARARGWAVFVRH
jgi:hypothetical protein